MTRQEALAELDLSEAASREEIEAAYEQIYTDFRIRLDHAPTPGLKTKYQEKLNRLVDAYVLLGGGGGEGYESLPSATPTGESSDPSPSWSEAPPSGGRGYSRERESRECPHCAEPILMQARLCRFCGRDVEPVAAAAAPAPARSGASAPNEAEWRQEKKAPIAMSGSLRWLIAAGVVLLLVVAGVLALQRKRERDAQLLLEAQVAVSDIRLDLDRSQALAAEGEYVQAHGLLIGSRTRLSSVSENPQAPAEVLGELDERITQLLDEQARACNAEREVAQRLGTEPPVCPANPSE